MRVGEFDLCRNVDETEFVEHEEGKVLRRGI